MSSSFKDEERLDGREEDDGSCAGEIVSLSICSNDLKLPEFMYSVFKDGHNGGIEVRFGHE
uniref:Uncharacterized protein MANES_10G144000 n=1 Tax=Rhizophora mucronata TaxID=61149 RepID=A0A2P2MWX3_RHIMU